MTEQEYYELPYGVGDRIETQAQMIWDALAPMYKLETKVEVQHSDDYNSIVLSY